MSELVMETEKAVVEITPGAINQIKHLIRKQNNDRLALRIGVKGGGCSGLSYVMNLEENPTERDMVYEIGGIRVLIDKRSVRFVEGAILDYTTANLLEGGWKWTNPNAARSCGCGTSFTPK